MKIAITLPSHVIRSVLFRTYPALQKQYSLPSDLTPQFCVQDVLVHSVLAEICTI